MPGEGAKEKSTRLERPTVVDADSQDARHDAAGPAFFSPDLFLSILSSRPDPPQIFQRCRPNNEQFRFLITSS